MPTNLTWDPLLFASVGESTIVNLVLYRPVGNELKPLVANHRSLQELITQR